MIDLIECKLGDVLTLQRGFDLPAGQRLPGSIPVISSSGRTGFHAVARVDGPGVVIGRYGTLGSVHFVEEPFWPLNTTLYVRDFKGNDPRFCAYLLSTLEIAATSGASAVPGVNRNVLHLLPVAVPQLAMQQAVAAILRAYDDLIEVNRRRIAVLESMARGLFEAWFLRPSDPLFLKKPGEIWPEASVGQIAEATYGYTASACDVEVGPKFLRVMDINKTPFIDWTDVPFATFGGDRNRYELTKGDVVVARMADTGKVGYIDDDVDAIAASYLVRLRTKRPEDSKFLFYLLAAQGYQDYIAGASTGTTRKSAGIPVLLGYRFACPPEDLRAKFDLQIAPGRALAATLVRANSRLKAARDLLLPRLLSGRLTLRAAERELAEAA